MRRSKWTRSKDRLLFSRFTASAWMLFALGCKTGPALEQAVGFVCPEGAFDGPCKRDCETDMQCRTNAFCAEANQCVRGCTSAEQCGPNEICAAHGRCSLSADEGPPVDLRGPIGAGGEGGGTGTTTCADVEVAFTPQTPTVMLLVDQSGSMKRPFGATTRWNAVYTALMNPESGIVLKMQNDVRFGLALYSSDNDLYGADTCPILSRVPLALGNYSTLDGIYAPAQPYGDTPTGDSLSRISSDLLSVTEPGDKFIVLATDGEPDTCAQPNPDQGQQQAIVAAQNAFAAGIRTFIVAVGADVSLQHQQDMANAGSGAPLDGSNNAPYYQALDPQSLVTALSTIINGIRSCTFALNGHVDMTMSAKGTVLVDGNALEFQSPDGWKLNSPNELELVGKACEAIKIGSHKVSVTFPCGIVNPG